ncbi:PTS sorbitol transporter subunit IIA [Megamonas hypermegale]|uniref:PTS glucitol/sorbitol transporter subunit IIA n=1 Tax=Megamonas hypermegale TaxID=158847 RepID=UPI000B3662BC|nr:PTS glucitol/sorbitol transporter subunit IIA [Megamonas hypermegale]OUO41444.1 PTS sorbitol transporter subunit IIA [Megamonas hypermegale]
MKKIYSTTVKELGPMVKDFIGEKMIILFGEMAPAELAEFCVVHTGNELTDTIEIGDVLKINDIEYKIVEVGCEVQKNLKNLGHICLRFNNNEEGESLEGSLYLEDKEVQIPEIGTEIAIFKA